MSGLTTSNLPTVYGAWASHQHKKWLEKDNAALILTCCNFKLVDGEEPHPSNYRGCNHTRDKMWKKVADSTQDYNRIGVLFILHCPWTVLRGSTTQQQRQPHPSPDEQACPATVGKMSAPTPVRHNQVASSQLGLLMWTVHLWTTHSQ
jgi:hypothetical protein